MLADILRRLLLMIPTILGIMAVSFAIVQFVPGSPVERAIANSRERIRARPPGSEAAAARSARAPRLAATSRRAIAARRARSEIHQGAGEAIRLRQADLGAVLDLVRDYATFNFGKSYYRDVPVLELIKEKLPVSISLGLWMTFISYAISIPLGVRKAVKDGSRFDTVTSALGHLRLRDLEFPVRRPAGRAVLRWVVLADLSAAGAHIRSNFADLSWPHKIIDYLWHITLPVTSLVLGSVPPRPY